VNATLYKCGEIVYVRTRVIRDCRVDGYGNLVEVQKDGSLRRLPPVPPGLGNWWDLVTETVRADGTSDDESLIYHVKACHVMSAAEAVRIMGRPKP